MNTSLAIVILRSIAILVFAKAVNNFYPTYLVKSNFMDNWILAYSVISLLVSILLSIVIWTVAPKISTKMLEGKSEPVVTEKGIVSAGCFLLGVYWFFESLFPAVFSLFSKDKAINYGAILVLLVSVAIIIGNKTIYKIYVKLRA